MVKAMKAGGKSMSKSDIAKAVEAKSGVKAKEVKAVMEALEGIIPGALKASGKFTIPGVTMIKLRKKPATPAGKRMAFGKEIKVKAKPARTIVKCFTAKSLKDSDIPIDHGTADFKRRIPLFSMPPIVPACRGTFRTFWSICP